MTIHDEPVNLVTIMNFPPDPRTERMCFLFLVSAIQHGADRITIFYDDHKPTIAPEHSRAANIEVRRGVVRDVGHPSFNLRFKLPTLASLTEPFLFLDTDTYILSDLRPLWATRQAKPWIGTNHQWIPSDPRTHRSLFLNSGVQVVGDPAFYDLEAILAVQEAAAPLRNSNLSVREDPTTFLTPGRDQALLFRYFTSIGYDYIHPDVGPEWNSCVGVTTLTRTTTGWSAHTHSLDPNYPVKLVHYWDQFKPWLIDDPIYASYADRV